MNRKALLAILAMIVLIVAGCSSHKHRLPILVVLPAVPDLAPNASTSITATVTNDPTNAGVNWTCSSAAGGACGTFNPATSSAVSGAATTTYTAPGTVGTVTITATSVTDPTVSISVTANITTAPGISGTFTFYVAGTTESLGGFTYSLAGAVVVDPTTGLVTSGEQDFNDGNSIVSAEPGGDAITSGSLTVDQTTGLGTLTVVTPGSVGPPVVNPAIPGETFAVQFVNASHAVIIQFDGQATSSGSLDLQTSQTAAPTGAFSFIMSGLDTTGGPIVQGGVFTSDGASITQGLADTNDAGTASPGVAFTGTITAPDDFGRGTFTPSGVLPASIVYYVVGPEAIRLIDVDAVTHDDAVGSAYGQGTATGTFGSSSLGASVISVSGTPMFVPDVLLGQFTTTTTSATAGTFSGIADVDELGVFSAPASAITGNYALAANGYGSMSGITGAGDYMTLGIYAVDPALNVSDPNNTSGGGGALVAEMDTNGINLLGLGVLVPQSDNATADFNGNYAFGAQLNGSPVPTEVAFDEADFIGNGTVTAGATATSPLTFAGTGSMNDQQALFTPPPEIAALLPTNVTFAGTFVPDPVVANLGRYTMTSLTVTVGSNTAVPLTVVAYQASAGQVFWIETDATSVFSGQLQQTTTLPDADAAKKTAANKTHKP